MKTRILLALSIATLAGCSDVPVYSVGSTAEHGRQAETHVAMVDLQSDPVGASIQIDSGPEQILPTRIQVELNESGMLLTTTRIAVDFANVSFRSSVRDTVGTITLRAGEPPPKRLQVSRGSPTGITVRVITN